MYRQFSSAMPAPQFPMEPNQSLRHRSATERGRRSQQRQPRLAGGAGRGGGHRGTHHQGATDPTPDETKGTTWGHGKIMGKSWENP